MPNYQRRGTNVTALSGAYVSATSATSMVWPTSVAGAWPANHSDFYVKGFNVGLGPNTIDTHVFWTSGYTFSWIQSNIDKGVALGCNLARIQGNFVAWQDDPTTYVTRVKQVIDYCHSQNLRTLFCFLNAHDDGLAGKIGSVNQTAYNSMFDQVMASYIGDRLTFGWDVGNELGTAADTLTLIQSSATHIHATDPTAKVTCSQSGQSNVLGQDTAAKDTLGLDFHDVHIYLNPGEILFWDNLFDDVRANTTKPILIGEFGGNVNASAAGGPHLGSAAAQARYIRAIRRYVAERQVLGFVIWEMQDDNTSSQFGLYDGSGNPRAALNEFAAYPSTRHDYLKNVLVQRDSPVVLDDFCRADSTTAVGSPPLGPAPTAALGTWGISSKQAYVQTGDAGGHNVIVWDAKTADPVLSCLFSNGAGSLVNAGLIFRYVDTSNYWLVQYRSAITTLTLYKNVAGTFTAAASNVSFVPVSQRLSALRVVLRSTTIYVYSGDDLVFKLNDSQNSNATQHGMYRWTGGTPDAGTKFSRFVAAVQARPY